MVYTVKPGDVWSAIAEQNGMTNQELLNLNPGYDIAVLHAGDQLTISNAVPYLTVVDVERQSYVRDLPFDVNYKDDPNMYQGDSKVLSKGVYGKADVTANVTFINGEETAREYGFRLVQASSYASGKNTTDIALVIDAMDILRDGRVDCFCLVASDGDYNPLAQRIRETGLKVLGYGEGKTPVSLIRSCSVFLYADRKENKTLENTPDFFIRRDMEFFDKAFQQAADGKEEVSLSLIGGSLKKMMPKFKVKRYGCKTLGKLYERLERYELVMTEKGVASAVRMKGRTVRQE